MKQIIAIALFLVATIGKAQEKLGTIEIEIHNIDNTNGDIRIGLYNSEETWLNTIYKGATGKIKNGKSIAVFTEDTGSSNNAPAMFGPPKWEDAKFEVKKNTVKQIINL